MGKNWVVLNLEKFQFAQKQIDFAGFTITQSEIKPHQNYQNYKGFSYLRLLPLCDPGLV